MAHSLKGSTAGTGNAGSTTGSTGTVTPPASSVSRGRVTSPNPAERAQRPLTGYGKVATLKQGNIVNLLEKVGGWWRIGAGQFVSGDYITVLPASSTSTTSSVRRGKVVSSTLNVRSGSTGNPKVATLKLGNIVNILEKTGDGWIRIADRQWVLGAYIREV